MYTPSFPTRFPSTGEWRITFFDEYEEGHPLHEEDVFVKHHGNGRYKVMRDKTDGWKFRMGEMDKYLMLSKWKKGSSPYFTGQWRMYTYVSIIHIVSARTI